MPCSSPFTYLPFRSRLWSALAKFHQSHALLIAAHLPFPARSCAWLLLALVHQSHALLIAAHLPFPLNHRFPRGAFEEEIPGGKCYEGHRWWIIETSKYLQSHYKYNA